MAGTRNGRWIAIGAWIGFLGVGLGAFGAHVLERLTDAEGLAWWRTGAQYHLLHAPVVVIVGLLAVGEARARLLGATFAAGIALFSGTLYAMALGGPRWLGAVTPVGGLALMGAWALLAWTALRRDRSSAG